MALALAELDGCLQSKRLGTVDKGIAEGFDSLSESRVASHPAQFNESLAFKRRCLPPVTIVLPKGIKTGRQRAFRAKGAQAQVNLKGPRASRHDEIEELLHEQFSILTHSNLLWSTGLPLAAIDAEHFQVRRIPQLTSTKLAETKERKSTGMAIPESRVAIARLQCVLGQLQGSRQDHLRQVCQFIRKYA